MAFGEMAKDPGWQYLKPSPQMMLSDQSKKYDSKKNVWVPDPEEGFVDAEIKSAKGDSVTVQTSKGEEKTFKKDQTQEMNPPKMEKCEDMVNLSFLNEASILYNLRARYVHMMIYTYSGLFCVVINPYKRLPIYTDSMVLMYKGKRRSEMPPHLYSVADTAYTNMLNFRQNQSMLITGESGAGKTENTKKVIGYLALVGASTKAGEGKKGPGLEEQIVQTNPVLEAFGNAKTVRNNNSSRFGKFIRTHFSNAGKLAGGDIEHYLLEKSRVIRQAPGERCYHIFYQMFTGAVPKVKENCLLTKPITYYHFVSQAELKIDGIDDNEEARMMDEAMDIMEFPQNEKDDIYKITASIMHLGEMKFKQRPREEQAEADGTEDCVNCATLLGIDSDEFMKSILKPRVRVGNEWVNKGQNLEQVNWGLGAMAKGIYARLFDWIVKRCNVTLDQRTVPRQYFIGVLDIAGFEIFDFNSFEQLWINFVNEKLQQFFNHFMFVLEQEEYAKEQIPWTLVDFGMDLAACIELIEKPMGIISMLDEECIVPKATDLTLASKLNDQHLGKHPNFQKPKPPKGKQGDAHFCMVHYAGTVRYNCLNWLEKNKDPLNDTCVAVLKSSKGCKLLSAVWSEYQTQEEAMEQAKSGKATGKKKGKSASMMTVSMLYRESLNKLMDMLHHTQPHFVRCIIPNEIKKSGYLDANLVLNQLTCNGVLEGIRICRKGFPNRMMYDDFHHRYGILAADAKKSSGDVVVSSKAMIKAVYEKKWLQGDECQPGVTKVFFRAGIVAKLEDYRDELLAKMMTKFQAACRWYTGQLELARRKEQRKSMLVLQRNIQAWCTLRSWGWFKVLGRVRPLLRGNKADEESEATKAKLKEIEENLAKEEKLRKQLEENNTKLLQEKNDLFSELQRQKEGISDIELRAEKLLSQKADIERQLGDLNDRLADQEERNSDVTKAKKKVDHECETLKKNVAELEATSRKLESEKNTKDQHIRSLQDEMVQQDELISKLNKEKKSQEEISKKLTEDLQAEEDKVNHMNKVKAKLEATLDEIEDNLEREKRSRQDLEKAKRKTEGDLKVAQETIDELTKQRHDGDANMKKKEVEYAALASRLEDEQSLVGKLQKQIKEGQSRIQELEEEVDIERSGRAKSDKSRGELQRELEELADRLDESGGATASQLELNKKREAEISKIRRDLEESNLNHEAAIGALRKKHNDAVAELGDQLDQLQKSKVKADKDKSVLQREIEDLHAAVDAESKGRQNQEKLAKQLEVQVGELQSRSDEQTRQIAELSSSKGRLNTENSDLAKQLEDAEAQINGLNRLKQQLAAQLEETKRNLDDEFKERQNAIAQARGFEHECQSLREQIEEEAEGKSDLQRQLSKAYAEVQQWRAKYDGEGVSRMEEIEEARRKLQGRLTEMQEQLDGANQRATNLDKARVRIQMALEEAQAEAERANHYAQQMEKKEKTFDKIIEDWKRKVDDLKAELEANQRETRNLSTEVFKLKNAYDEANERAEAVARENKSLAQEIKDLADQLGEGGRSVHELQKIRRRLELEKEELQTALDEAEAALEAEESKVLRAQLEVSQIRQEIEKRIHEKEEDFENTRKNHQRALDSMQASLEAEAKGRGDLLKMKKKLEGDINELEISLDGANRANADAQKNIKKYQEQIRELQAQIEDEQRIRDELHEHFTLAEKRCNILQSEREEALISLERADRGRKHAEADAAKMHESINELAAQNASLGSAKRSLESEMGILHSDLDDAVNQLKSSEEKSRKAMMDAAKLADELRSEQEHSQNLERCRRGMEQQIKDIQVRLDEAEAAALKGGKKLIQKLESRVRELEADLDGEQRRHQETYKNVRKQDRKVKELQFQVDEANKNLERMHELIDKLQGKVKLYKHQQEEAEQLASGNLAKYRQVQLQLDDAVERADAAENSLQKVRVRSRSAIQVATLNRSGSIMRSASRTRASTNE